ncbi:MAG TPA: HD domain-containing phosphohydrolase [Caldisericia bacterium]|nr:HD domain-containing phosphohydrolase [Caldisericia bacterium]
MNDEENIIRELASAWEQLSIFYDWNSQIEDATCGEKQFQRILARLTRSTGSSCGIAVKLGRGRGTIIIASYSPNFENINPFLEHFKNSLPDIEEKLARGQRATDKFMLLGTEHHMLAIPWRKEKKLKGAFVFIRPDLQYNRAESILLSNATYEMSLLIDYANLSSRFQEKNNELGILVIKNLENYKEIFLEAEKVGSLDTAICNMFLPEDTRLLGICMNRVFFSSKQEDGGRSNDVPSKEILAKLEPLIDKDFSSAGGKVLSIRHHKDDRGMAFATVVETTAPSPQKTEKLHKIAELATKEALRKDFLGACMQEAYASTLFSMSTMIKSSNPQAHSTLENAEKIISILSGALCLDEHEKKILEKSLMLVDVSLIYMDHGALEEYLVKGTTVSGPQTMKVIMEHPIKSAELVQSVKSLSECVPVIRTHHERWDGYGYPMGLKGEEIPKLSRILVFVQALSSRIAQHSMDLKDFVLIESERVWLSRQAGRAFDPEIVKTFLESF